MHPKNQSLCIKIDILQGKKTFLFDEVRYLKRLKSRSHDFDYPFVSQYHGDIQTNKGAGVIYGLVRDERTSKVSRTLSDYLQMEEAPFSRQYLYRRLLVLQRQMIKHRVFSYDLVAANICCKILNDHTVQCILIDGVGNRELIPISYWSSSLAERKVKRRFKKLIKNIFSDRELALYVPSNLGAKVHC